MNHPARIMSTIPEILSIFNQTACLAGGSQLLAAEAEAL